jgi:hypothetical protein
MGIRRQERVVRRRDHQGFEVTIWTDRWRELSKSEKRRLQSWLWADMRRSGEARHMLVNMVAATLTSFASPFVGFMMMFLGPLLKPRTAGRGYDRDRVTYLMSDGMVAIGRCGSCCRPLTEAGSEAGEFVQCPDCGAAWHMDVNVSGQSTATIDAIAAPSISQVEIQSCAQLTLP